MSSIDIQDPDLERSASVGQPARFHHRGPTILVMRIVAGMLAVPFLITLVTGTRGGVALVALGLLISGAWLAVHVHRRAAVRPDVVVVDAEGVELHRNGTAERLAWKDVTVVDYRPLRATVSFGTRRDPEAMTFDADLEDFSGFIACVTAQIDAARSTDATQDTHARGQALFRRSVHEDIATLTASVTGVVLGLFVQPVYFAITVLALPRLAWHWLTAPHSVSIDDTAVWIIRPLGSDVIPLRAIRAVTFGSVARPAAAALMIERRDGGTMVVRGLGAAMLPLADAVTAAMRRDRSVLNAVSAVRRTGSAGQIAALRQSALLSTAAGVLAILGIAWLTIATGVPLRSATIHGNEFIARTALLLGGRPGSADGDGFTALHHAATRNEAAIAGALIRGGADVDARARTDGATPLHMAAEQGHREIVGLLVDAGADVNSRTTAGRSPLAHAAISAPGDTAVARMLLDAGANHGGADDEGRTALHHAAAAGHGPLVHLLARAGARLEATDMSGHRALHAAVMMRQRDAAAALLVAGADVNGSGAGGHTALSYAAAGTGSPLPLITTLLDAGARADIAGDDGWNAVQRAASHNNLEMLQVLARRRAPLNRTDGRIAPALWIAVEAGNTEAARILLRGGASPYVRWEGRNAIDLARAQRNGSLVALMQMR